MKASVTCKMPLVLGQCLLSHESGIGTYNAIRIRMGNASNERLINPATHLRQFLNSRGGEGRDRPLLLLNSPSGRPSPGGE